MSKYAYYTERVNDIVYTGLTKDQFNDEVQNLTDEFVDEFDTSWGVAYDIICQMIDDVIVAR
jgi:hypothetical protein